MGSSMKLFARGSIRGLIATYALEVHAEVLAGQLGLSSGQTTSGDWVGSGLPVSLTLMVVAANRGQRLG